MTDSTLCLLADLGVKSDPGTSWHPDAKPGKYEAATGHLPDLDDETVLEHQDKPEAASQRDAGKSLAAEDSGFSNKDVV
jgi:hypothetical protein